MLGLSFFYCDGSTIIFYRDGEAKPVAPKGNLGHSLAWRDFAMLMNNGIIVTPKEDKYDTLRVSDVFWDNLGAALRAAQVRK
ncbi:hypothetical protein [Aminobacterium mobile]|uniref:hypothetical protein n=1 Tax=Aminobacterium mobile TaxID=81467 RepID=UPI0004657480|nr:hypothetical protein [Aminobacterium mobile]